MSLGVERRGVNDSNERLNKVDKSIECLWQCKRDVRGVLQYARLYSWYFVCTATLALQQATSELGQFEYGPKSDP